MFEKIAKSAENVVAKVSVSRRGFLGKAAKGAAAFGAALAALAVFPGKATASGAYAECYYTCPNGQVLKRRIHVLNPIGAICPQYQVWKGMLCPYTPYVRGSSRRRR